MMGHVEPGPARGVLTTLIQAWNQCDYDRHQDESLPVCHFHLRACRSRTRTPHVLSPSKGTDVPPLLIRDEPRPIIRWWPTSARTCRGRSEEGKTASIRVGRNHY